MKIFFYLFIFFYVIVYAQRPFYCEKSSYIQGNFLYVVGIAIDPSEPEARQKAFENGTREIKNFFQKEFQLPQIDTERLHTENVSEGYYACRLLKVDISRVSDNSFGFSTSNIIGDTNSNTFHKVTVITNPAYANLLISGTLIGKTDSTLSRVSHGTHDIIIQKEGYNTIRETVKIQQDSILSYQLNKKTAQIYFSTNITQGKLFINNKFFKNLSSSEDFIDLEVLNKYKIKITSENHHDYEKEIILNPNDNEIRLNPILQGFPAKVTIVTDPSNADVYIRTKHYGKTPLSITLNPDTYDLLLKINIPNYIDFKTSFTLKAGERITLPVYKIITISEEERKQKEESFKRENAAKKLEKEKEEFGSSVLIPIGYGASPIQEETLPLAKMAVQYQKKLKYIALKGSLEGIMGFGGKKYKLSVGGELKEKFVMGYIFGLSIPVFIYKGLYVGPMAGISSLNYTYRNLIEKSYSETTKYFTYDISKSEYKVKQNFLGFEIGWQLILDKQVGFYLNADFAKFSDTDDFKGAQRSNYNLGVILFL